MAKIQFIRFACKTIEIIRPSDAKGLFRVSTTKK